MDDRVYTAAKTLSEFHKCDDFFRAICGPIGSGKSVASVIEVIRRCKMQKPGPDGMRRSRWVIVRNTTPQLKDTTLKTWFDWVPPGQAGKWKETDKNFYLEFDDVRAEILFRPLDSPDDVKRVLSLELTGCWLNEAREIPKEIVEALQGRLGRYPSKAAGGASWYGMIADTNPPELDSFWHKVVEGVPIEADNPESVFPCTSFTQPSGLDAEAENRENLPDDYYERLAVGRSEDWVNTYVHGMYSPSLKGVPVYRKSFQYNRHRSDVTLEPFVDLPVIIGLDFGRTPAASFKQMTMDGQILTFCEAVEFGVGLEIFIRKKLRPILRNKFPTNPIVFIGDPSGKRRNDTDEGSCLRLLKKEFKAEGAVVKGAFSNDPNVRIAATERALLDFPGGEPSILYDPSCKWLLDGLRSRYRYSNVRDPDTLHARSVDKNDWSHIVEADQYANMFLLSGKYSPERYQRTSPGGVLFPFETQNRTGSGPASYIGY